MTSADCAGLALAFPGDSEMASRMRAHPWAETALGEPSGWPASLSVACRLCLTSRFPMVLWWGPDLYFLYNDAYLPFLGEKHPALGKPGHLVWGEIWQIIGSQLRSVLDTGQATFSQDVLLPLNRGGFLEETYYTYSFSPLYDDAGVVRGVFTAATDSTDGIVGARRLSVLNELGGVAGRARHVPEAFQMIGDVLGRSGQDVPFAAAYLREPGSDELALRVVSPAGATDGMTPAFLAGWPVGEVLRTGQARITDVAGQFGKLPSGGWPVPPADAMVLPLTADPDSPAIGAMVLAASAGRPLDEGYSSFLSLVAQQTAAVVNSALAYQVQQNRAEELAELDRAKTVFFSNISHEFRTPLALIMGPAAELQDKLSGAAPAIGHDLDLIQRNGMRLGKLVNSLLDFSQIEAGRMQARIEPVDLAALTADLASVFRSAIERAGLAYQVDCPPLPGPVLADREMWEKVILNLLSNALKFTFDGSVSVRVRAAGGQAIVEVADTGGGIPAAEQGQIFERFHQVAGRPSRSHEGSGIGLALVRELVSLQGGTISVASAEGAGSTFTIRLPLAGARARAVMTARPLSAQAQAAGPFVTEALSWLPGEPGPEGAPGAAAGGKDPGENASPRILIADDNADMREYLSRLLSSSYAVTAVADGQAAVTAASADPPALVIADVMMPLLDGTELAAALRAEPRTAGVPVLLLSARAGSRAAVAGIEAGADDYLVKPFAADELLARVRGHVELAGVRSHDARWRAALINSISEAFFVIDADGAVVEINDAFTEVLGFGKDGLPYRPRYPWWPPSERFPEADARIADAYEQLMRQSRGEFIAPVVHRDGRPLWVEATFSELADPDSGRRMVAGTLRDVTTEHYAGQRESALAAMGMLLARADDVPGAIAGAIGELRRLWRARRVLAASWNGGAEPGLTSTSGAESWADLPAGVRDSITGLRDRPLLRPTDGDQTAAGITLDYPPGVLALWLELDPAMPFTAEDRTLLALLCGYLGQALHRIRQADEQRATVIAVQRAFLSPAQLPPGFAARYEPAAPPLEIGGDWYDVVELPDGRIGLVVGDCVGHTLDSAITMGQLRSACRALLLQDISPAQMLSAMDRFAAVTPGGMSSTVFCGVLDPRTGELVYSSAGHPPPVVAQPDGEIRLLDEGRSPALAVQPGRPGQPGAGRRDARWLLRPRATLLLYTDGLVERRRARLDAGIDRAAHVLAASRPEPLRDLAGWLMSEMAPAGGYEDDVALLLYRSPGPLELTFPAGTDQLAPVRAALREWLARCELTERTAQDVLIAAGEAVANAYEHGSGGASGEPISLSASATGTDLYLTVTDRGRWKDSAPVPGAYRGHGLPLMRTLMTEVTVSPGQAGTTVRMRLRITP